MIQSWLQQNQKKRLLNQKQFLIRHLKKSRLEEKMTLEEVHLETQAQSRFQMLIQKQKQK